MPQILGEKNMRCRVHIDNDTVSMGVFSGWSTTSDVKLVGSTFPVVPVGSTVDKLSFSVPKGLHAIAFYCRVDKPRRMGSGPTAYLDRTPLISSSVLLGWEEDGKYFFKADEEMSAAELARFNPFVRSNESIFLVERELRVAYVPEGTTIEHRDPEWVYKYVPMNEILSYITKRLTFREIYQRAESRERSRGGFPAAQESHRRAMATVDRSMIGGTNYTDPPSFLAGQAREVVDQLELGPEEIQQLFTQRAIYSRSVFTGLFWARYKEHLMPIVRRWSELQLSLVVCRAPEARSKSDPFHHTNFIREVSDLNLQASGPEVMRELAARIIAAAMLNLIFKENESEGI